MMKSALVSALVALQLKSQELRLPDVSEVAYVRELTVAERIEMVERYNAGKGNPEKAAEGQAWIIFTALEDSPGQRAFDGFKFDDVKEQIKLIPAEHQNAICLAVQGVSGLLEKQEDKEKN